MGDPTFPTRLSTTRSMLDNTATDLFSRYKTLQSTTMALNAQKTTLEGDVQALKARLSNIREAGETYDREFIDRSAGKNNYGTFRRNGISTLQDWIFLIFFASYGIICFCLLLSTITSANPVTNATLVIVISFIIGIMMTAVIMRFV